MRRLPLSLLAPLLASACTAGAGGGTGDDDDVTPTECQVGAFTGGVSTLAGCDVAGSNDGARVEARFANPVNVVRGPDDLLYVADFDNAMIRTVDDDGAVETLVAQPGFERPFALAFVGATLYVSTDRNDAGEHSSMTGTIWRVDVASGEAEVVVRDIGRPRGLLGLPDGRLVVSDYQHHAIRVLDPDTASLTNLAGMFDHDGMTDGLGTSARFSAPYGMALLPDGTIAVADLFNNRIRGIDPAGNVFTIAGTGIAGDTDGDALAAAFSAPQDLAVDGAGNLYVSDLDNFVIRKITPDGEVSTLAGTGEAGFADAARLGDAKFYGMEGLDVSADGRTLWVADGTRGEELPYHRVRVLDL